MVSISAAAAISFADLGLAQQYFGKFNHAGFRLPQEALLNPLHSLRSENFLPFLNATFRIAHPTRGNLEMTLIKIIVNKPPLVITKTGAHVSPTAECFTLVFSTTNTTTSLKQGQYAATQDKLGLFDLFLVPGARNKLTRHYEAVFNRV